ncbi:MAG: ABC transporter permease [Hyphomicrobiales bacterium]
MTALHLPRAALRFGPYARILRCLSVSARSGLLLGGAVLLLAIMAAVFAPWLAPRDPYAQELSRRFLPPFWMDGTQPDHLLGTDGFGRDYLSRLIYGTRVSLLIGVSVTAISGLIGATLGLVAGYFGGKLDLAITFLTAARLSLPIILVAMAIVVVFGGSTTVVMLTLGFLLWDQFAIVMRTATQQVRQNDFVAAARLAGSSHLRIMTREILPNLLGHLAVVATAVVADAILLEAALSFLGFGVQEPIPSWGLMLAKGREVMLFDTWVVALPGAALLALVFTINLVGDGLRDVIAPDAR